MLDHVPIHRLTLLKSGRKLTSLAYFQLEDTLWQGLTDFHVKLPMGVTGENLAEKYNITRQDCDEFALLSQKRWGEGKRNAIFTHTDSWM